VGGRLCNRLLGRWAVDGRAPTNVPICTNPNGAKGNGADLKAFAEPNALAMLKGSAQILPQNQEFPISSKAQKILGSASDVQSHVLRMKHVLKWI